MFETCIISTVIFSSKIISSKRIIFNTESEVIDRFKRIKRGMRENVKKELTWLDLHFGEIVINFL